MVLLCQNFQIFIMWPTFGNENKKYLDLYVHSIVYSFLSNIKYSYILFFNYKFLLRFYLSRCFVLSREKTSGYWVFSIYILSPLLDPSFNENIKVQFLWSTVGVSTLLTVKSIHFRKGRNTISVLLSLSLLLIVVGKDRFSWDELSRRNIFYIILSMYYV